MRFSPVFDIPRIYIAGYGRNAGKTTVTCGLLHTLRQRGLNVAYMKPVSGQKRDHIFFHDHFELDQDLSDLNPIPIKDGTTREYIHIEDGRTRKEITKKRKEKVFEACERIVDGKDFLLLEGTGLSTVGYSFDMSNAVVAKRLEAPVILVADAGIGSTIDLSAPHFEYFLKKRCPVLGVIINRVKQEKKEVIEPSLNTFFRRLNMDIFGYLPYEPSLDTATPREIGLALREKYPAGRYEEVPINNPDALERPITSCIFGSSMPGIEEQLITRGILVVVPAENQRVIRNLALHNFPYEKKGHEPNWHYYEKKGKLIYPPEAIIVVGKIKNLNQLYNTKIPIWSLIGDNVTVINFATNIIHHGFHKLDALDASRIDTVCDIVSANLDIDKIIKRAEEMRYAYNPPYALFKQVYDSTYQSVSRLLRH